MRREGRGAIPGGHETKGEWALRGERSVRGARRIDAGKQKTRRGKIRGKDKREATETYELIYRLNLCTLL